MKIRTGSNITLIAIAAALQCTLTIAAPANTQSNTSDSRKTSGRQEPTGTPQYQIYDIGVVDIGDTFSQGFGVSRAGIAVGRSIRNDGSHAFSWTVNGGIVALPDLAGRSYCVSNSANDSSGIVGTAATTVFGSGRLPVIWQNGVVSQLPLPVGQTLGDANSVNASNVAGNVGIVYDIGQSMAFDVGALPGMNGALAFGVSNTGYVVGSSMFNQGAGLPFIWSDQGGMVAIPLAADTSLGQAEGVNSSGWVVGTDGGAFAVPFLYDGTNTYRLQDLIPANSGWDLSMNTSSSAMAISENNIIVGTGVHNGETHAYAMVPATPTPTPTPTPTVTPSATPTPTASPTATPTATPRPTPTPRPRPAPRPRPTPR